MTVVLRRAILVVAVLAIAAPFVKVYATDTSNFQQTINAGTLATSIVDGSYAVVSSPAVAMTTATFGFSCQTITGTFGTTSQKIYVSNPDAADNGWTLTVAASAVTSVWTGGSGSYDFNDSNGSGCTDGGDVDSYGGQMTVDASVGTLAVGACSSCATSNITKGSSTAFVQGTVDSVTLLNAAASSNDIGDWTLTGVSVSQKIPAEQAAGNDYSLDMVLTITAS